MSLTCPNCGFYNEEDSRFCSQCGFSLTLAPASKRPSVSPSSLFPERKVSQSPPVSSNRTVFVSSPRCVAPARSQHSGLAMGLLFLFVGSIIAILLFTPVIFAVPHHGSYMEDFGMAMGDFGSRMGDFGSWLGNVFGTLGDRLGDFFAFLYSSLLL